MQELKEDSKAVVAKCKKLQDFHDKYDSILEEEKKNSRDQYLKLTKEKEATELRLSKELDDSKT